MNVDVWHAWSAVRLLGARHARVNEGLQIPVSCHSGPWLDLPAFDMDARAARLPT